MTSIDHDCVTPGIEHADFWRVRRRVEDERRSRRRQRTAPLPRRQIDHVAFCATLEVDCVAAHELERPGRVAVAAPRRHGHRLGTVHVGDATHGALRVAIAVANTAPQRCLSARIDHHLLRRKTQRHHAARRRVVGDPRIHLPTHAFDDGARSEPLRAIPHAFASFAVIGVDHHVQAHHRQPVRREMVDEPRREAFARRHHGVARLDGRVEVQRAHAIGRRRNRSRRMTVESARQTREVAAERAESRDEIGLAQRGDVTEAVQPEPLEQRHHVAIRRHVVRARHPGSCRADHRADHFHAFRQRAHRRSGQPTRRRLGRHDERLTRLQRMTRRDTRGETTVGDADPEGDLGVVDHRSAGRGERRPHGVTHGGLHQRSERLVTAHVARRAARGEHEHPRRGDLDERHVRHHRAHDRLERAARAATERGGERRPVRKLDDYDASRGVEHGNVIVSSRGDAQRRPPTLTCTVRCVMCEPPRSMPDHATVSACTSRSEANTSDEPSDGTAGRSTMTSTDCRARMRDCNRRASCWLNDDGGATTSTSNPSTSAATVVIHSRLARGGCASTMRSTATPASMAAATPRFGTPTTANHEPLRVAAADNASAALNAASPEHATVRPRTRPPSANNDDNGATTGNGARTTGAPKRVRSSVVTPSP